MNASTPLPPPVAATLAPPSSPPVTSATASAGSPTADAMIVVEDVSKFFGSVVAVSDVRFAIGHGVTALLGPNGAGKSTLFRMMCGLTPPSRGRIQVLGANPRTDRAVRGQVSLVPQQDALFDHLDAMSMVTVAARSHGVDDPGARARWALEQVDLHDVVAKPLKQFSKGMRQRVKVACALVNDPAVLVLDEPLTGLDPVQRRAMIALFHRLGDAGRCVLVSSHVLDEVARLGSRVLVIAQGRLIATGDYHDLRALMDDRPLRIRLGVSDPRLVASTLIARQLVDAITIESDHLVVDTRDADAIGRSIAPIAVELGLRLHEVTPLDDNLEAVFRYLVEGR